MRHDAAYVAASKIASTSMHLALSSVADRRTQTLATQCRPRHDLPAAAPSDPEERDVMIGRLNLATLALSVVAASPVDIRIEIRNASATTMECQILAAHWYTPLPAALVAPRADATFALVFDANKGQPLDDPTRRLPLETLFCGHAGRAWETRGVLDLRAMAVVAAAHGVARGVCEDDGDALRCATMP